MRLTILFATSFFRVCAADPEPASPAASVVVAPAPPAVVGTVDSPPPPIVGTAPVTATIAAPGGVARIGQTDVRVVHAGPRELRVYGLHDGRPLRPAEMRVQRATVMTVRGPEVVVLEPREDYYVAVTPFDVDVRARCDIELDVLSDPAPPALVVVDGFAPIASVRVGGWVPAPPSVAIVAPAPPSVRVRGGVRVNAFVPAPRVVVVAPRPPSISIGFGIPSATVIVRDDHHHGNGRGLGHVRGHGRGHGRHGD